MKLYHVCNPVNGRGWFVLAKSKRKVFKTLQKLDGILSYFYTSTDLKITRAKNNVMEVTINLNADVY